MARVLRAVLASDAAGSVSACKGVRIAARRGSLKPSVTSPGGVTQAVSSMVWAFAFSTADLDGASVGVAELWLQALRAHPKARAAARFVNNGLALWDASLGSAPMADAALLAFFHALEIVVEASALPSRDESGDRSVWEGKWAPVLLRSTGDDLATAVREAALELRRIETKTFETRIKAAGIAFGLDAETIEKACQFSRIRSRQLAHATTGSLPKSIFDEWLVGEMPLAYSVSVAFVRGYLASIV